MTNKIPRITIGTDLGDMSHAICVLDKAGEIIEQRSITNHRDSLTGQLGRATLLVWGSAS